MFLCLFLFFTSKNSAILDNRSFSNELTNDKNMEIAYLKNEKTKRLKQAWSMTMMWMQKCYFFLFLFLMQKYIFSCVAFTRVAQ
jgi:hypothetical protein